MPPFSLREPLLDAKNALSDKLSERCHSRTLRVDAILLRAASRAIVAGGPEWRVLTTVYTSSYASMGWGASKYTRASAEGSADIARAAGVEVRIDQLANDGGFTVYVKVQDDTDIVILKNKGMSLRVSVKNCMLRGTNPRVLYPYLPHGYERSVGLDPFGRDLLKTTP